MLKLNKIKKPNKVYLEWAEDGAISQFVSAMEQDFVTRGALLPDAHQGYSLPIGSVVETKSMILPSWVGYDIGCGVCAIPTSFSVKDIKHKSKKIYNQILRNVPVGFNKHKVSVEEVRNISFDNMSDEMRDIYGSKSGDRQVGTLGGGNHFIEIGYDENDEVWIIIHSGSRGVGHGCAQHYMKLASPTGKASEGHFGFDIDSENGMNYIKDMNWCLDFALLNRKVMLGLVQDAIRQCALEGSCDFSSVINRNHNHATSSDGVHWIHRKGATHAEKDMMGVIPGNMRDGSFIVCGKDCEDSLYSSSHGAGRVLSRKKAKEKLDIEEFCVTMEGIQANVDKRTLDESPMAYKNIFEVMRLQHELVEVVSHIKPIINIKG